MRVLIVASLIAFASSARIINQAPIFSLVEERSFGGGPSIDITFSDGYKDTIVLSRFYANEEERADRVEACHYTGYLANEVNACVAMTGCVGSEDLDFTILSDHVNGPTLFKWTKEGNVEVLDSSDPSKIGEFNVADLPLERENGIVIKEDQEVIVKLAAAEASAEKKCSESGTCSLPPTQHLKIRVGYDDGIKNHLGSASKTEAYIASIWPHLQVHYCHVSLGSKVLVERLPGYKHYAGKKLIGKDESLKAMYADTVKDMGDAHLMMYFGFIGAGYLQGGGIAYRPAVCAPDKYKNYRQSNVCYGTSLPHMGELLAHELGHNLGMHHDFHGSHAGKSCDKTGFMSYSGNPNKQWSTCSKADFTALYTANKDRWCMKAAPKACVGVSAPPAGPTPSPPAGPTPKPGACPTENAPGAPGDGYCDDHFNTEACKFDGGDCCNNQKEGWNWYCIQCKCMGTVLIAG